MGEILLYCRLAASRLVLSAGSLRFEVELDSLIIILY